MTSDAEMIAAVRRLVTQMEGRALYLQEQHQCASIHVYKEDFDGMRAALARLEAAQNGLRAQPDNRRDGGTADNVLDRAIMAYFGELIDVNDIDPDSGDAAAIERIATYEHDHGAPMSSDKLALLRENAEVVETAMKAHWRRRK